MLGVQPLKKKKKKEKEGRKETLGWLFQRSETFQTKAQISAKEEQQADRPPAPTVGSAGLPKEPADPRMRGGVAPSALGSNHSVRDQGSM